MPALPWAHRPPPQPSAGLLALATSSVAASCVVAALVIAGDTADRAGRIAVHVLVAGVLLATGIHALRDPRTRRFGRLLVATAVLWSASTLSESSGSLLYSTGRVVAWLMFPVLIYAMLTFPEGRLRSPRDRWLIGAVLAVVAILYVGSALVSATYPRSAPWSPCTTDCPANAFMVLGREPAWVADVLGPLRDGVATVLLVGVTATLAGRLRGAGPLRRGTVLPVVCAGVALTGVLTAFVLARSIDETGPVPQALGQAWAVCVAGVAAAFAVGLVRRRLLLADVLAELTRGLDARDFPGRASAALRRAVGERGAQVLVRDGPDAAWRREDGAPADVAAITADGAVVREAGDDGRAVLIVLEADAGGELADAVASLAESALGRTSLQAELDASRRSIAAAADDERLRIQRDLHDGVQQQLIALRIRLSMNGDALTDVADHILEDIRALAAGIYPPLLEDLGVVPALRAAARGAPVPVHLEAQGITRTAPELERAVYFTCMEALQNAVKHARGATRIRIELRQDERALTFVVADDGAGFDAEHVVLGLGLRNLRHRIEALGGFVVVSTAPGRGTVVEGRVPLSGVSSRAPAAPPDRWRAGAA
jgi:signal transduction histidine kinase